MRVLGVFAAVLTAVAVAPAQAGTTITTNLSGNAVAIANIDARNDGAQLYDQARWHSPFALAGSLPSVTLPAGSYRFRIISPDDAGAMFPALTADQKAEMWSAWTYNTPWVTNYLAFDASAVTQQFFDGAGAIVGYGSAAAAYAGGFTDAADVPGDTDGSFNNLRYTTRAGVTLDNPIVVFTGTTTLLFAIPDNGLFDNGGGVSVLISTIPEPVTLALVPAALALLGRRRARMA